MLPGHVSPCFRPPRLGGIGRRCSSSHSKKQCLERRMMRRVTRYRRWSNLMCDLLVCCAIRRPQHASQRYLYAVRRRAAARLAWHLYLPRELSLVSTARSNKLPLLQPGEQQCIVCLRERGTYSCSLQIAASETKPDKMQPEHNAPANQWRSSSR